MNNPSTIARGIPTASQIACGTNAISKSCIPTLQGKPMYYAVSNEESDRVIQLAPACQW